MYTCIIGLYPICRFPIQGGVVAGLLLWIHDKNTPPCFVRRYEVAGSELAAGPLGGLPVVATPASLGKKQPERWAVPFRVVQKVGESVWGLTPKGCRYMRVCIHLYLHMYVILYIFEIWLEVQDMYTVYI